MKIPLMNMFVANKSKIIGIALCCLALSACESSDNSLTKQSANPLDPDLLSSPWLTFKTAVEAFHEFNDTAALNYAQELEKRYPDQLDKHGQGTHLLRDLRRRKAQGLVSTVQRQLPTQFDGWPADRKVAYLIEGLQDIDEQEDRRLFALVQLDDAAVPALIDCIETDDRLSRCVYAWREYHQDRFIFPVRRIALWTLEDILGQDFLGLPGIDIEKFNAGDPATIKEVVQKLRDHYQRFGKQPLPERMMAILMAPDSTPAQLRKAAKTLVKFDLSETGWPVVQPSGFTVPPFRSTDHPRLKKFESPTMGEAILQAMDREFEFYDQNKEDQLYELNRSKVAYDYSVDLILLNDRRLVPLLKNRIDTTPHFLLKVHLAYVCFRLGDEGPLEAIALGLERGQLDFPAEQQNSPGNDSDQPRNYALREVIWTMSVVRTKTCLRVLKSLASAAHPYHRWIRERLKSSDSRDGYVFHSHPFVDDFYKKSN